MNLVFIQSPKIAFLGFLVLIGIVRGNEEHGVRVTRTHVRLLYQYWILMIKTTLLITYPQSSPYDGSPPVESLG